MNGTYSGAFDLDFIDNFGYGGGNGDPQEQHQHQQLYMQNGPQYDSYDPSMLLNRPSTLFQSNVAYNSTGNSHRTYLPGLDSASLSLQMNQARIMQPQHQQHQQHQQQYAPSNQGYVTIPSSAAFLPPMDSIQTLSQPDTLLSSSGLFFPGMFPDQNDSLTKKADKVSKENPDLWLEQMQIKCSDVSLEPLSGAEVLKRVRAKTEDVVTRYLPCVEFLVKCQQELRAGLLIATQKRMVRQVYRDAMTPKDFHKRYLAPYPSRFYERNANLMESKALSDAVNEINVLCQESKRIEYQGCEMMKNTFLGGMKDGESWGLRKWLSKHGGALHICNDLECILRSCQALDRSHESTRKLCERLRPLAKQALDRLKNDVPPSYQEVSTAHPYLPFFHRLESALKAMANFDPDDDDVICIDSDDEIEEVKEIVQPAKRAKDAPTNDQSPMKKQRLAMDDVTANLKPGATTHGQDSESKVIEIVDKSPAQEAPEGTVAQNPGLLNNKMQDWECRRCTMLNPPDAQRCCMCDRTFDGRDCDSDDEVGAALRSFNDFPFDENSVPWDPIGVKSPSRASSVSPLLAQLGGGFEVNTNYGFTTEINDMVSVIESIARAASCNQHRTVRPPNIVFEETFWDVGPQYASALRLFLDILINQEGRALFFPVDDADAKIIGRAQVASIIRHPLCLRDIAQALIASKDDRGFGSGILPLPSLSNWNMWRGMDLLQALDLVFLNNLAFNGKEKTKRRSATNRLRKLFWDKINEIVAIHVGENSEKRREFIPTRRGENSGFVIQK